MDEQEIQGRINGLSMAVEVALIEIYTLRKGSTEEALKVINSEIGGLASDVERTLSPSNFCTGTVDALRLILDRLNGIYHGGDS